MGGGPTTPELVAASCDAGALGSLGGAYLNPERLRSDIRKVKSLTQKPFNVNLFVPSPEPLIQHSQLECALRDTRSYRKELGLADPVLKPPFQEDFEAQISVVLSERPAAFSFVFGMVDRKIIEECHQKNIYTIGAATTLEEGQKLEALGIKAVVAQGFEAGGHRATFLSSDENPTLGTMRLTQTLSNHLKIPVIASGGIMDGNGILDALQSGAQAAQLGTAFLLAREAGTSEPYKQILRKKMGSTRFTRMFSGRLARGIENRFISEMESNNAAILPFPAQNVFTRDIRSEAVAQNKSDFLSLWAGTGVNRIQEGTAREIIGRIKAELDDSG